MVFSEEWIGDGNYIGQFLHVAFTGKLPADYERENGRSNDSILETLAKLEKFVRDYFVIFAHVEQGSGLWEELDGGRIGDLGRNELFRQRTLGFQKVRTHDKPDAKGRVKVKQLGDGYPAEVEGIGLQSHRAHRQGAAVLPKTWRPQLRSGCSMRCSTN